jgi:hypothetical protein
MADKTMLPAGPWTYECYTASDPNEPDNWTHVWAADVSEAVASSYGFSGWDTELVGRLIAAAGTAAHECAQMGYDPVEAVGALPRALEMLDEARIELGSQALGNMDEPDLSDAADRVAKSIADLMADICSADGKEGADQ